MRLLPKGTEADPKIWWHKGILVKWTREGKLVEVVQVKKDSIIKALSSLLKVLVNEPLIDGYSTPEIARICSELCNRRKILEK